jgi:hypothetical protein
MPDWDMLSNAAESTSCPAPQVFAITDSPLVHTAVHEDYGTFRVIFVEVSNRLAATFGPSLAKN